MDGRDLLKEAAMATVLICICFLLGCSGKPNSHSKTLAQLERVSPEDVGWSSEKLEQAREYFEEIGSAAVLALHDGKVFVSWGGVTEKYWIHSIRKPLLSALYGIHVARGNIDLDATLQELGIDDIRPSLTAEEKQATVRDLLKSRSGVYHEAAAEAFVMMERRPTRGSHPPGTFFYYNNWDFNVLGTIFEQQTGTKIFEEFEKEIAIPLGMEDFRVEDCMYHFEKEKSMHPAYHLRMTARDMARFGLLYMRDGKWGDNQLIPPDWIIESTETYSVADSAMGFGYGYMWNTFPEQFGYRRGFFHTGAGVHLLAIIPDQKYVFVHRVDTDAEYDITTRELGQLFDMILNARLPDEDE
jgi:CubicO group peptidase (beta-lactamase class C family)